MIPNWLFQVMRFGAGVGGSGAVWYFLSERNDTAAVWTVFATVCSRRRFAARLNVDTCEDGRQIRNSRRVMIQPQPAFDMDEMFARQLDRAHNVAGVASHENNSGGLHRDVCAGADCNSDIRRRKRWCIVSLPGFGAIVRKQCIVNRMSI